MLTPPSGNRCRRDGACACAGSPLSMPPSVRSACGPPLASLGTRPLGILPGLACIPARRPTFIAVIHARVPAGGFVNRFATDPGRFTSTTSPCRCELRRRTFLDPLANPTRRRSGASRKPMDPLRTAYAVSYLARRMPPFAATLTPQHAFQDLQHAARNGSACGCVRPRSSGRTCH